MAISEKTTTTRREEIVNACEKLYKTMSFREITLKEISEETSFSRPSIYNYFATKEEIFLALFEREYDRWNDSLEEIHRGKRNLSGHALAEKLAKSLAERPQLLKFRPDMTGGQIRDFIYAFFPFMFGIYPYTEVTEKQKKAMEQADVDFELQTAKDIIFRFIMNFFNN